MKSIIILIYIYEILSDKNKKLQALHLSHGLVVYYYQLLTANFLYMVVTVRKILKKI